MKTKYILTALLAVSIGLTIQAQTSTPTSTVLAAVKSSGILNSTNYAIEPYLTYAPKLAVSTAKVGGGVLAIYNLNSYVGAGLGVDYLGQFSLVSGNATLKLPVNVGKYINKYTPITSAWASNLTVTPFALGGIGTPLSGSPNSISTIEDVGAYLEVGHLWGGKFNVGACYGQWNNAGDYSGKRYHLFAGWSKGF